MNDVLELKVQERTAQLQHKTEEVSQIRDVTIMAMASLAETRDKETGNHLRRTQAYIRALGMKLRDHRRFKDYLTEDNIESCSNWRPCMTSARSASRMPSCSSRARSRRRSSRS